MFKIGTLVKLIKTDRFGVIVDTGVHHDGDWKYEILFPNGDKSWWTDRYLEVLCSK